MAWLAAGEFFRQISVDSQDSLIFVCCIDFPVRRGEIDHPMFVGSRDLQCSEKNQAACAAKKR